MVSRLCLWKETLYPPATLASHSTSCLPASLHIQSCPVMPAVNGHTHTPTPTHTHSQIPVTGGEGVSSTTSSVIFIGVKVSDSFRVLQTDDYIWSQLNEKSEAVCFSFLFFNVVQR